MKISVKDLLFGDVTSEQKDVIQNIYVFRLVSLCWLFYSIEIFLNEVGIFIVDKQIFRYGYLFTSVCVLIYIGLVYKLKFNNRYTKYVSITVFTLIITAANISLTYHMALTLTMPVIVAGMYTSKRFIRYTVLITILSIIVSTYGGYFFGVCDANMVLLTTTSLNNLNNDGIFAMNKINENPMQTLTLFYVFPRCFIAVSFVYISTIVNKVIKKSYKRAVRDKMTGLYNKNKLLEIIEDETYVHQKIAIIYWDVNRLKYVNDNYGHQSGDELIACIAHCIESAVGKNGIAMRYGGDEFIAITDCKTEDAINQIITRCEKLIEEAQRGKEYPVSASVGFSLGTGDKIEKIIAVADKNMYENKKDRRN